MPKKKKKKVEDKEEKEKINVMLSAKNVLKALTDTIKDVVDVAKSTKHQNTGVAGKCEELLELDYDFDAFMISLYDFLPTLRVYLTNKNKGHILKRIEFMHAQFWDTNHNQPRDFREVYDEFLQGMFGSFNIN